MIERGGGMETGEPEQDVADGRLERVLPDSQTMCGELFGGYPSRRCLSAKVRIFLDSQPALTAEIGSMSHAARPRRV